jgi:hypothetical protein
MLDWYQKELDKDSVEIDREKNKFANSIKKLKKEEIFKSEVKKINLWQRIKKVLMGI